ncbi:MAG: UDP-N-acetylglucosamine 2-epimerase [Candidatus Fermentimicrarchaeum limneticum]|uniref:UDP-N-acetylglucosamine 2-epimerase n=1 Tax=Fermentimicrarchaeum limneticum TaxID=2795018 RepID=A0A7D6BSB6_FERL1|nr:MAG: UDP-N-acetylglucosamine 2-epimerase [Candidatus Fermentimicrarchaeum limneticum]
MLHVLIGTKGQLIKMAPVMLEMDKAELKYRFINASQHAGILDEIRSLFGLREYDHVFYGLGRDISRSSELLLWMLVNIAKNGVRSSIFRKRDYVILHGDAPPALLGLIIAKMRGLRVIHVEAGERTHKLFEPFPEEPIRRIVDMGSNHLFALSDQPYSNLKGEGHKGKVWRIRVNTIVDSVRIALKKGGAISPPSGDYVLASIHRFETISNYKRLEKVVRTIDKISEEFKVVFPIHESTRTGLESKHLMMKLKENRNVVLMPLLDYFSFIGHIKKARYVVTDGGGPQQETYLLGKPCLVMREVTEHPEYPNVYVGGFDLRKTNHFIRNYDEYGIPSPLEKFRNYSPSRHIVRIIQEDIGVR